MANTSGSAEGTPTKLPWCNDPPLLTIDILGVEDDCDILWPRFRKCVAIKGCNRDHDVGGSSMLRRKDVAEGRRDSGRVAGGRERESNRSCTFRID